MFIGLGALAAIAGKALITGTIALLLASLVGLKSLTGGQGKTTTYEVVARPVYSASQSHSQTTGLDETDYSPHYAATPGFEKRLF